MIQVYAFHKHSKNSLNIGMKISSISQVEKKSTL